MALTLGSDKPKYLVLFVLGFVGILSSVSLVPQLISLSPEPLPISIFWVQVISVIQSSVLLMLMVVLGGVFAKRVNLTTPVIDRLCGVSTHLPKFTDILVPAIFGGVFGGFCLLGFFYLMAGFLPIDFLQASERFIPPWHTKLLYGGITEEILVRWGLMSFFTWGCYKVCQTHGSKINEYNYVFGILLSALLFGVGHLPVAQLLTDEPSVYLYLYIIVGNAIFGCIAGWLFYKRGLECAILAHMVAHITVISFGGFGVQ
ncbi:CPBP family intramembrane glutamic endopeptidase [Paraglaciecola arctica]|uniref:Abortive infection protein n=1 Tax=Paraglaciecola arctica BSs20135 TaxID=493475 RepID=K6XKD3_9ALTE|nr:CPBP family intramembrane glutamic endopeptidase [Paraglaciecola arctica]GAC21129.1 abortive infection protein [Paraglaciecola arctica BSs20135]